MLCCVRQAPPSFATAAFLFLLKHTVGRVGKNCWPMDAGEMEPVYQHVHFFRKREIATSYHSILHSLTSPRSTSVCLRCAFLRFCCSLHACTIQIDRPRSKFCSFARKRCQNRSRIFVPSHNSNEAPARPPPFHTRLETTAPRTTRENTSLP